MAIKINTKRREKSKIAVVIPSYRVSKEILRTVESIGSEVAHIIVVDDACPEYTGALVTANTKDPRVEVLFHVQNLGVGGATKTGYLRALELNADIVIKLDGDGQMDSSKIPEMVRLIIEGEGDYIKGNRFFDNDSVPSMPKHRIFGNLILSFLAKFSTGYWRIFDPNNGFTAISSTALKRFQLQEESIALRTTT